MAFHDVQFPLKISLGSGGGPGFKHQVISLPTGAEEIVSTQSLPRWRFDVGKSVQSRVQANALVHFYVARHGLSNSFPFRDPLDYTSNDDGVTAFDPEDQNIGTGDGTTLTFQLRKEYGDAGATEYRTITKPVSSRVRVSVDGVEQVDPGWTYPWTVSRTTGVVTFTTAPPASEEVTAGYEFDCEVRFDSELDEYFRVAHDGWENHNISVPLIEKFPAAPVEDRLWYGGAGTISGSATAALSKASGRTITLVPTGAHDLTLPAKAAMPLGGPHYYLVNTSATHAVTVKDGDDATTVGTVTATGGATPTVQIVLGYASSGARKWYALG
jgi:uncharacterized protein (TIGR02217 family)